MTAPKALQITYQRHGATGLLCAFSPDLPGFRVYGKTLDELEREVPLLASAIVKEQFGIDCPYRWEDEEQGFAPLPNALGNLIPEMACA